MSERKCDEKCRRRRRLLARNLTTEKLLHFLATRARYAVLRYNFLTIHTLKKKLHLN